MLNGPIKRTLFKLEKGSYSTTPTAFNNEYYIFYLKNKGKDDQIPSFKSLEKSIEEVLKYKYTKTWIKNKLKEIKPSYEVKNYFYVETNTTTK